MLSSCTQHEEKQISFHSLSQVPPELVTPGVEISGLTAQGIIAGTKGSGQPFQIQRPAFEEERGGKLVAQVDLAKPLSMTGQPLVPILTQQFHLEPGQEARVILSAPQTEESDLRVPLMESQPILVWGRRFFAFSQPNTRKYYPGKLFDVKRSGDDLLVHLYPVQVDQTTGKLVILRQGNLRVEMESGVRAIRPPGGSQALIISSAAMAPAAKLLQKFHLERYGVESEVVSIEEISKNETLASLDDFPPGYKEPAEFKDIVRAYDPVKKTGYQFDVSRKLISFLKRKAAASSELRYVVLLGDSQAIPPSYYFWTKTEFGKNYGVTDQCYSLGKNCLEPVLAVGRLPFSSEAEVQSYLVKVDSWLGSSQNAPGELSLYGGKVFGSSDVYVGELAALRTLDTKGADWAGVTKHFRTEGNFKRPDLLGLVSGSDPNPFAYYLDHGNGNRWFAGDDYVTSKDILAATAAKQGTHPFIVSVSCANAAFDEPLSLDDNLGPVDEYGTVSVGTSLLKSPAGAVAFLGSAREGLGSPEYLIDKKGNLNLLGTTFGLQMFDGFLEKYRQQGKGRTGDALLAALKAYAFENGNDMSFESHAWTYLITELLGDPLLPLPERIKRDLAYPIAEALYDAFDNTIGAGFPRFLVREPGPSLLPMKIQSETASTTAKFFKVERNSFAKYAGETLLKTVSLAPGTQDFPLNFPEAKEKADADYFIRVINEGGVPRERQIFFSVEHLPPAPQNSP